MRVFPYLWPRSPLRGEKVKNFFNDSGTMRRDKKLSTKYRKFRKALFAMCMALGWVTFSYPAWKSVDELAEPNNAQAQIANSQHELDFSDKSRELYVNLKAALVIDNERGEVLYAKNAQELRSIASISKLLMAVTLLDLKYNRDSLITINRDDMRRSSKSHFYRGDIVRAEDLFLAALIGSDNRAARALCRTFGASYQDFAQKMNATALRLGLRNTSVVEPTGLDEKNRSTAADCAMLANRALMYPEIVSASSKRRYSVNVTNRRGIPRVRRVGATNLFVYSRYKTLVAKTGYIRASDYCLTTVIENAAGQRLTVVALGAPWSRVRFKETRRLAEFGFRKLKKRSARSARAKS